MCKYTTVGGATLDVQSLLGNLGEAEQAQVIAEVNTMVKYQELVFFIFLLFIFLFL
jgi:hypothetical protein